MARYHYYLHRYGDNSRPVATFSSRRALCDYMKSLQFSPLVFESEFFLHIIAPKYSAIYNFKAKSVGHLSAVLSRKTVF